jgi:hypothetical protein
VKKFWILWVYVALFGVSLVFAGHGVLLRPAGTASTAAVSHQMIADSSDTFEVDTITSDVLYLSDYPDAKYAIITLLRDTVKLCDSCNDSFVVATSIWTQDNTGFIKLLVSDVQGTAYSSRDTVNYRFYVNSGTTVPNKDSTLLDKVWIRTIMSDSVITNKAITGSKYVGRYFIYLVE